MYIGAFVALAAGVITLSVVCGDTEEFLEQSSPIVSTPTESVGSAAARGEVIRWANLLLVIPKDSGVIAAAESIPPDLKPPAGGSGLRLTLDTKPGDNVSSSVLIDAETGSVIRDDVLAEDRRAIDEVLSSLVLEAPDLNRLPWPYTGEIPRDAERDVYGGLTFVKPERASGIETYTGLADPGGAFVGIKNGRSVALVKMNDSGTLAGDMSHVLSEDKVAFDRWVEAVEVCGVKRTC